MLAVANPDTIIEPETRLRQDIPNAEIFPPTYNVCRRDRADGYGVVLVATKVNLIIHEIQHATTAEAVLVQVQRKKKTELLLVGTPSATSEHRMEGLVNPGFCENQRHHLDKWGPKSS